MVSLLLICRSYPPVLGGSEIEAQRVCSALLRRGHRVTILCAGGAPMPEVSEWVDPCGVPVRIFGGRWHARLRDYAFAAGVAWTLFKQRRDYQLVYFLMQGLHLAAGLPVAHWLGKPVVMKVSGSSIITAMRNSWLGRLELQWLQKWAHRVMVLNPGMAGEAVAAGFRPSHLLWMPNPVDIDDFAPCPPDLRQQMRASLGIPQQAVVTIFVGRLAPEKELTSLLGALALAAQRAPEAVLVLVGDGPVRKDLENRADQLGLQSRVRFAGRQTGPEVRQWLQASDVFALVSSNEGLSCSLLEAMSAGLPSVISNIPANTQLVDDGIHGIHTLPGDQPSVAKALMRLIEDEALRKQMGQAARQRVIDQYSTGQVIARYETLFGEALDSQPK